MSPTKQVYFLCFPCYCKVQNSSTIVFSFVCPKYLEAKLEYFVNNFQFIPDKVDSCEIGPTSDYIVCRFTSLCCSVDNLG